MMQDDENVERDSELEAEETPAISFEAAADYLTDKLGLVVNDLGRYQSPPYCRAKLAYVAPPGGASGLSVTNFSVESETLGGLLEKATERLARIKEGISAGEPQHPTSGINNG